MFNAVYPDEPINNSEMKFKSETIDCLKEFKKYYPYSVGNDERLKGMQELLIKLSRAYNIPAPSLTFFKFIDGSDSFQSYYDFLTNSIVIIGKLSIITFLHEFAHALGKDEPGATMWSVSLFRRVYPSAYKKLQAQGHCLIEVRP